MASDVSFQRPDHGVEETRREGVRRKEGGRACCRRGSKRKPDAVLLLLLSPRFCLYYNKTWWHTAAIRPGQFVDAAFEKYHCCFGKYVGRIAAAVGAVGAYRSSMNVIIIII